MLNIEISKIDIEGFGSIDKLTLTDFEPGLIVVRGNNGTGKTSAFSAFVWALYGKTLKDKSTVTRWDHLIDKEYQGVKVEIHYTVNEVPFKIIRCQDYKGKVKGAKGGNRLIFVTNKKLVKVKKKKQIQEHIEKSLGMTYDLLINAVVFGQKMKRIIESSGPKQKEVFEDALNLNFIKSAKQSVETDINIRREELAALEASFDKQADNIANKKLLLKQAKKQDKNVEENKVERVMSIKFKIKTLESQLNKLLQDRKKVEEKINENEKAKHNLKRPEPQYNSRDLYAANKSLEETEKNIPKFTELLKDKKGELKAFSNECKTCGNKLKISQVKEQKREIKKAINKTEQILKNNETDIESHKVIIKNLETQKTLHESYEKARDDYEYEIRGLNSEMAVWNTKRDNFVENIQGLKRDIQSIESEKSHNKSDIGEARMALKESRKGYKEKKNGVKKLKKELEDLLWLNKMPLSNSGLKNYIFNSKLDEINQELYEYAQILGFQVEFAIKDSARKDFYYIVSNRESVVPFEDLSGGQQQLVNIAIAFAMHSVVNHSIDINLLVMDEVFESLDTNNIHIVNELVKLKSDVRPVYLITHRKEFNPVNSKMLEVSLSSKGLSKYVIG